MKREDVTGGKYFKADDLRAGDLTLSISEAEMEEFKAEDGYKQKKLVLGFRGKDKKLVCGKTKADALFDMLGDDTDEWIGQRVRLTLGKANYQGKRVDCVDVAAPIARPAAAPARAGQPARPAAPDEDDDAPEDIPY